MRSRLTILLSIAGILLGYTTFKINQIWPGNPFLALGASLIVFFLMLGGTIISRSNEEVFSTTWFHILAWIGSLVMGTWATFILLSLPLDLIHIIVPADYLPANLYLGVFAASLVMAIIGFFTVKLGPKVVDVQATLHHLSDELSNLKFVQLSDLHVGPTVRRKYVENMVAKTLALDPDFIFLTGDFADAQASAITEHLEPLRKLRAKHGVYYVTGNHEYYWGAQALIEKMSELGFIPLINGNRVVRIGRSKVLVAGVTDPMGTHTYDGHRPDVALAIKSEEDTQLKILLAHRPDAFLEAERRGFDLQFSGHTHSGQFFPFSLFIGLAHKYYRGLHRHGRLLIYVNPGTGYWGPANRFGVRAEITRLILTNN